MGFAELPKEILQIILNYAIIVRGLRRGMRLRLVCKRFAAETIDTLFTYRSLDDLYAQRCGPYYPMAIPPFTRAYLEYRVRNTEDDSDRCPILSYFRIIIQDVMKENANLEYNDCVRLLCGIIAAGGKYEIYQLFRLTPDFRTPLSGAKYSEYDQLVNALFIAAVVTNTTPIIERHIALFKEKKWGYLLARNIETFDRLAVRYASPDTMRLLLSSNDPTGIDEARRNNMFVEAAAQGNLSLVKWIHDFRWSAESWDFRTRKKRYETNLVFKQALKTPSLEVWDYLVEKRQEYKLQTSMSHDTQTQRLTNCTLQGGEKAMMEHLLELGADKNGNHGSSSSAELRGRIPLLEACRYGDEDAVRLLVTRGADTSSAVAVAAAEGHTHLVQYLLEHGANPSGGLPRAAEKGYMDIVRTLLDAGVDAGEIDDHPRCPGLLPVRPSSVPIACAIGLEHVEMVNLLKERGARTDGYSGQECLKVAKEDELESMLILLGEWGIFEGSQFSPLLDVHI